MDLRGVSVMKTKDKQKIPSKTPCYGLVSVKNKIKKYSMLKPHATPKNVYNNYFTQNKWF